MPKRNHQKKEGSPRKGMSMSYFVKKKVLLAQESLLEFKYVKKTFMAILNVKKTQVQDVCKKHFIGNQLTDKRGGDTRSKEFDRNREIVNRLMGQICVIEKHYCRGISQRLYLSSDLNINKFWRMYSYCHIKSKKVLF